MRTALAIAPVISLILAIAHLAIAIPLPIPAAQAHTATVSCTAITIITARGTSEDPGEGRLASIASDLANERQNSKRIALDYPADLFPYSLSLYKGIQALTGLLNTSVSSCPQSKIVLLGYSQGAHVIGNVLCGGAFAERAVDRTIADKVSAIIFMADPRHVPGKSFDVGSSTRSGLFPRPDSEACDTYASRMRSYCDSGDPVCDSGFDREVHSAVVEKYRSYAVAFVTRVQADK
ncbi:conserved hypothetical protein [Histoplasma capsulatum G186AR]|uniref:Acetylxylan esterase n=1 Tax=Ajellomyces capsulatus (strain G186AR / H82 / ATCC MYA-2454 / RMSCC 2432) TaxID=447093 RepID=C0NHY8_AJECG|nr:uncharacterized protein HCBG_02960 [Histoplasma capsulatum G186AR]EEH09423.1 conserved hypothetical protein [Histoplasma capsulatum G186AR]